MHRINCAELTWTFLNQKDAHQARKFCGRAIMLYKGIGDERGLRLGVLTRQRVISIFRECLMWAVGR
jgi:hypothetical protein